MSYAMRAEKKGKHVATRPGRGFDIELPDAVTAEKVVQAMNRAFAHGQEDIQTAVKSALGIEE